MQSQNTVLSTEQLQTLGSRLAELRRGKGLTAVEVAQTVLGYSNGSHVAVTRLERGAVSRPRVEHLRALADYYGVEPDYLYIPELKQEPVAAKPVAAARVATTEPTAAPASKAVEPTDLAGRVREVRLQVNLDQASFAIALRSHGALITEDNVRAWESGARTPNPIQLRALCRFAYRTEAWFQHGDAAPEQSSPARPWLVRPTSVAA